MPAGRPKSGRQLSHCREAGMNCSECVSGAAFHLVQISAGLNSSLVRQMFFLLYPESACASMATEFVQAVHEHLAMIAGPALPRRSPASALCPAPACRVAVA